MNKRRRDHIRVEEKFKSIRNITYDEVMSEFPGTVVKGIDLRTAHLADSWSSIRIPSARLNRSSWEWVKEYPYYQNRPNRFEISLWRDNILCALCYGQTSVSGTRVRMNLIESTPIRPSPLRSRALPIIAFSAAVFADIVGADELWVLDPDPKLEGLYIKEGFSSRATYHGKRVGQRRIL
ncbi:hypothetical protein [Sessilibacter corallicola]|uniref:hypothetical protein n=1 Tax=Sessilibacter corallicola TaxID=2904075 RepID=UPI001E5CCB27|nr:hypothetical protein [Sessilibacter corallicola]MCE2027308.1 hypothetical protein [Sessilibacter corallicola]